MAGGSFAERAEAVIRGLRPGGVGAIHLVLRPSNRWAQLLRWMTRSECDSVHLAPGYAAPLEQFWRTTSVSSP